MKDIYKGIKILGLSLWIPSEKTLILSDLHFGMESEFHKQGILLPKFNFLEVKKRLEKIFKKTGILSKIIVTGDLKHSFGKAKEQEWNEVLDFLEICSKNCKKIVLLRGNHDVSLPAIAAWKNLLVEQEYFSKKMEMIVLHGDKMFLSKSFERAKLVVIGHEHPAVSIEEHGKKEKYKAFLKGRYGKKTLIVLPSFNFFTQGTDVLNERLLSPFLQKDLSNFETWLVEDKTYYFGKLKNLKKGS